MSPALESMGPTLTEATIENLMDVYDMRHDRRAAESVRRITVSDALVNPRVTLLALPTRYIKQLGLQAVATTRIVSSKGEREGHIYEPLWLTIRDRSCTMDVLEVPDDVPVLIGHLPLHHLDFVVDIYSRTLICNPEHGGEHVYDLF